MLEEEGLSLYTLPSFPLFLKIFILNHFDFLSFTSHLLFFPRQPRTPTSLPSQLLPSNATVAQSSLIGHRWPVPSSPTFLFFKKKKDVERGRERRFFFQKKREGTTLLGLLLGLIVYVGLHFVMSQNLEKK